MLPEGDRLCPRCGQLIPAGQEACPVCTRPQGFLWSLERETLVLFSIAVLVVFFVITGITVKRYHASQLALGGRWYLRGEEALKSNRPEEAVEDFHTALVYARDNPVYQMRLAEALVKANHLAEAGVYLRTLWVTQPGNGTLNLLLARLAAKSHDVPEAIRYYHNAVYGVWESDPETNRRTVRIELSRFLLAEGDRNAAESELIALQTELPPDAKIHAEVGSMFAQVEDYRRALQEFQQAVKINPKRAEAWAGAGMAAYQLADYFQARHYLQRAVELDPKNQDAAQKLQISSLVLELDPFQRRLSLQERSRRTITAFGHALSRLNQCAQTRGVNLKTAQPAAPFASVYSNVKKMQPMVTRINLQRNPDLVNSVMDLVMQMEEAAQQACGTPPPPDQALLMISHQQGVKGGVTER